MCITPPPAMSPSEPRTPYCQRPTETETRIENIYVYIFMYISEPSPSKGDIYIYTYVYIYMHVYHANTRTVSERATNSILPKADRNSHTPRIITYMYIHVYHLHGLLTCSNSILSKADRNCDARLEHTYMYTYIYIYIHMYIKPSPAPFPSEPRTPYCQRPTETATRLEHVPRPTCISSESGSCWRQLNVE